MQLLKDIKEELKQFLSSKTVDALIPPIIYVLINNLVGLKAAAIGALSIAIIVAIFRLLKKESILYALGGIVGVVFASGFALISDNAANYFLPKILGSGGLLLLLIISLVAGKPAAAILSHLSRGWQFDWFLREDIKPAYREVTIGWTLLVFIRLILQIIYYQRGDLSELGWISILLGFPATLTVMILTLVYGIWRLKKLGGPGIHEFEAGKNPPWEGQKKGF